MRRFASARLMVTPVASPSGDPGSCALLVRDLPEILSEPVLRHLPEALQWRSAQADLRAWIEQLSDGSDVFRIDDAVNGRLVGLLIIARMSEDAAADWHLGYLFAETAWGRGFATELLQALVTVCRDMDPRPARLVGGVGRDNPASARVLTKAGFLPAADLSTQTTDMFVLTL